MWPGSSLGGVVADKKTKETLVAIANTAKGRRIKAQQAKQEKKAAKK